MANDPVMPTPDDGSRHIFAEQVTRDAVVSDLQGLRLWGTATAVGGHAEVTRLAGGTAGPFSLHVQASQLAVGFNATVPGITTGVAYTAGDQVGDPVNLAPGTKIYHFDSLFAQVVDLDKQLDNTCRLWLIFDPAGDGSTWGDAGDANPLDITGSLAKNALALTVESVHDTASRRYLHFVHPSGIPVYPTHGILLDCGTATPTFTTGSVEAFVSGALRGVADFA